MLPSLRARLRQGDRLVGPMITLSSPDVAELLGGVGFDWMFIDTEHTPIGPQQIKALLQAAGATPCLVRLASDAPTLIAQALDAGAAGIIVPQVNTASQAADIVAAAKYAPAGRRGRGLARAHGFGLRLAEYSAAANETTAVVVQAEHRDAVANIREIVRVDGVDAVMIGPYDLSSSLGHPGELAHPEVIAAIATVRRACQDAHVPIGYFGISADAVAAAIAQGFTLICVGVDVLLLMSGAQGLKAAVDAIAPPAR